MIKNLVVFAMIMLVMASGYMYGTKIASDMGINKIPSLGDIASGNLNGDNSGKEKNVFGSQLNPLNGLIGYLKGLWSSIYDYFNGLMYSTVPASIKDSGNSKWTDEFANIISSEEARNIAQQYIQEPGAVAGNPKLVNNNGELVYIVPVLLKGVNVGEIYIDAQTGQNLGGAGGVSYNEPGNSVNNKSNPENGNTGNGSTAGEPDNNAHYKNESGRSGSIECVEQP